MANPGSNDLTQGSIVRKLISFFLPVAAGTIVQQLYNTADAIIVGRFVGTVALASVGGSTTQIVNLLIGFFVAITNGSSVIVAHFYGEKNKNGVARAANTAVLFCFFMGLAVTAIGETGAGFFLHIMGAPEDTVANATAYLRICFCSTTFVLLYNMGAGILRACGDSRRPFIYLLSCCLTNIVLDLLFVAVLGWGVRGAAAATAASQILSCCLVLLRLGRTDEPYRLRKDLLRIDGPILKRMLSIGVPAGLQNIMFGFSNAVVQTGVNSLGTTVVAGWTLSGKIDGFYWAVINAAGTSVMNFVGQNYGAGRIDRVKDCVKTSFKLFSVVTVILSTLILAIGKIALPLFSEDQALLDTTWELLWYFVPFYFTWTLIDVLMGTLRGVGDAVVPVIIMAIGIAGFRIFWVLVVFGIFSHNLMTLAMVYVASWVITDIAMFLRYRHWSKAHRENIDSSLAK